MEVSIIIVNYNTFQLTCKCIQSVMTFTRDLEYEIILVDNASSECDAQEFSRLFPGIILMQNRENLGFAGGNNTGISVANGKTILLLNSDTELRSDAIGYCCRKLHNLKDNVKIISCKLNSTEGKTQYSCGRFPSLGLQFLEIFRLQKVLPKTIRENLLLGGFFDHNRAVYPDWVWATFFMFRREMLEVFPGKKLADTYFLYMEDMEWCLDVAKAGGRVYFDPAHTIVHYGGASTREFFGEELDPTIQSNYVDLVKRYKGRMYASLFFGLARVNSMLSRNTRKPRRKKHSD